MTFQEAKEKLLKMAGKEKYCSIEYRQNKLASYEEMTCQCTLAIDDENSERIISGSSTNWKESFLQLERKQNKTPEIDPSEIPKMDT